MPLLEVHKLTMRFGGLTAVNNVDLAVDAGKIYSVIGPNGAGKTTVFNAITGIYEPTEGVILFQGRELRRPLTGVVIAVCVLIGLATGIGAALFMGNIDKLWKAAVRNNLYDDARPFALGNVARDAVGYWRGDMGIELQQSGVYHIVRHDAAVVLGQAPSREEANRLRDDLETLSAKARTDSKFAKTAIVERDGTAQLILPENDHVLASFPSRDGAEKRLAQIMELPPLRAAHRSLLLISLLAGSVIGAAGAFAIWQRARRTPDVISRGGLTRTFQNIRLFHHMTVLENVLVGMNRKYSFHVLGAIFWLPGARREEQQRTRDACALLDFVGLKEDANDLAKNLPYGDQRRLEIARALATEPKLILLDEPAAGMNPAESDTLMGLVRRIRDRGITVVLIEHHMKLVMSISDRIAVLDHGEKIAEGTPAEVKANPKVVEAYLGKEEVH